MYICLKKKSQESNSVIYNGYCWIKKILMGGSTDVCVCFLCADRDRGEGIEGMPIEEMAVNCGLRLIL